MTFLSRPMLLLLPLVLAGCGGTAEDPAADAAAAANAAIADPVLAGAIFAPILSDPQLDRQANSGALRPPPRPYSAGLPDESVAAAPDPGPADETGARPAPAPRPAGADCPRCTAARESLTLAGLAERQPDAATRACAAGLRYSAGWANRLPAALPLHPQARVIEAAGTDTPPCALRVAHFSVPRPLGAVTDWYYARATGAGFSPEHRSDGDRRILGGTRARDGAAFALYLTAARDGGTDVTLVVRTRR